MSAKLYKKLTDFIEDTQPTEDELLQKINDVIMMGEPSNRTITNRYSKVKKFLRENYEKIPESFLKQIRPPPEITQAVIDADTERRSRKDNIRFTMEQINTLLSLKNSIRIYDLLIYLQIVSGRRINELVQPEFEVSKGRKKQQVIFSKLSKQSKPEKSPVLLLDDIKPEEFITMLDRVRKTITELNLSVVDMTQKVNKRLKNLFPKSDIKSSHNLRGMYAIVMWYKSGRKQNINGFITDVLNHKTTDASLNYSNFILE